MTNRMSKWLLGVLVMLLMLGSAVAMAAEWVDPWTGDPMSVKVTGALAPETAISIDDKTQVLCYTFTPTANDVYRIYSTGAEDSYMYLYDDQFALMAEDDDTEIDTNFSVCCNMKRGRTYYCYFTAYPNGGVEASYRVFVRKAPRTDDGLGYRISDGVMTIVGYVGAKPNPVIPKTITTEGRAYPVESIGIEAFLQAEITGVTIPEGVRYIDDRCFAGCTKLKKIVMPDSVNQMGKELFDGCSMLGEVVMSKNVTEIGRNTFRGCSALNSVTIYQNVTTIDANAFANIPANMTIRGCTGSYAETFAQGKAYPFESIGTMAFETMELNRVHSAPVTGITTFRFVPKEKGAYTVTASDLGEYSNRMEVLDSNWRTLADTTYGVEGNSISAELTANTTYYVRCTLLNYGQGAEKYSVTLSKEKTVDGYAYRVLTQGTESEASIILYAGSEKHLTIPNTLGGYQVKTIAGGAFSSSAVLSVKTPENLWSIGANAFRGCKSLKTVDLSASTRLGGIEPETFCDCTALSEIMFPDSIEIIAGGAFLNCTALTNVVLPADLTSIYGQAFGNCTGMTAVTIPKGIVFIHIWAFDNHASELVISGYSGSCAETFATDNRITFKALGTVVIPPLVLDQTSHVAVTERKKFSFTPSTTGSYILSVGETAYSPKLFLYDAIGQVLSSGQELSSKLTAGNPYYYTCTLPTYDQASSDTYPITLRKAPSTADGYEYEIAYNEATIIGYTGTETALAIPEAITEGETSYQVTRIESYAFENGTFTSAILPAGIRNIYYGTFKECKSLKSIAIPDSVQGIWRFAFNGCTQLAKVEMSQWTMHIGDWAFQGCQNLTIHAPADSYAHSYATRNGIQFASSGAMDVTPLVPDQDYDITFNKATARKLFSFTPTETGRFTLQRQMKAGTGSLRMKLYDAAYNVILDNLYHSPQQLEAGKTYYYYAEDVTTESKYTFRLEKANLVNEYSYVIENNGAVINGYFGVDSALSIPNTVNHEGRSLPVLEIEDNAFSNSAILSVKTPENLRYIGWYAFRGCKSLKTVDLSASTQLGGVNGVTFRDCTALSEISLPDNVNYIGWGAFFNCKALTSVVLPANLTSISEQAFANCTGMTAVKIPRTVMDIDAGAFAGCVELKKVIIPSSVTRIQADAFKNCQALTIYGFTGSSAETYAQQKGISFVLLIAGKKGDINEDGVVDREDAELLMQELCQLVTLTDAQKALAEVVIDGVLNNKDVVGILRTPAA